MVVATSCAWSGFVEVTPFTKDPEAVTMNRIAPNPSYVKEMLVDNFSLFLDKTDYFWET